MSSFLSKVGQGLFLSMLGYEIGEKVNQEDKSVVVQVKESDLQSATKENTNEDILITLAIAIFAVLVIVILYLILKVCTVMNKRVRRNDMIELNERGAQPPRI